MPDLKGAANIYCCFCGRTIGYYKKGSDGRLVYSMASARDEPAKRVKEKHTCGAKRAHIIATT